MPEILQGLQNPIKAVDHAVGRRLRLIRIVLGLSQSEVAKQVGCSLTQWQKCENGHKRISVGTLLLVSNRLKISINQLLDEELHLPSHYDLSAPLHKNGVGDGRKIKANAELFLNLGKISDPSERQLVKDLVKRLAMKQQVTQ